MSGAMFCRAPHVDVHRECERWLVVDATADVVVRLDEVGSSILAGLGAPTTLDALVESLRGEFDADPEVIAEQTKTFVDRLLALGLVVRSGAATDEHRLRRRYLDLLKRALVNLIYPEHELRLEYLEEHGGCGYSRDQQRVLRDIRYTEAETFAALVDAKRDGRVWKRRVTRDAHTMVGLERLDNLERCAVQVFDESVEGDFLEAGACQGGASIFLRGLQVAYGQPHRRTWVADSFAGLPEPTEAIDRDLDFSESVQPWLAASLRSVQDNFRTYGLLSDEVLFLPGWFADTLPSAPVQKLAMLRLDGDLYESTRDVLDALYDRVSPGGFVIIDDYWAFEPCRVAVDEFLAARGAAPTIRRIDWTAVFWQKTE